ncbi:hypothetical protein [Devosia nitrariae]|nr:hypothetical protein [Devosia nitrariae]
MTSKLTGVLVAVCGLALLGAQPSFAENESAELLQSLANGKIRSFATDPMVIEAINAQNAVTGSYDQAKLDSLDTQWRAEISASDTPLISATLGNRLSQYLTDVLRTSGGFYTEIFVMDGKGLNVGQSNVTSDYWQGDEGKWQNTFLVGPDAVDIGDVEMDESTKILQSQVSVSIADPATGQVIGAVTVGVDVSNPEAIAQFAASAAQ